MTDKPRHAGRLDAFTDAAFAFALTLLLVPAASRSSGLDDLGALAAQIPGFAFAFALIANFWYAHVRWSRRDGAVTVTTMLASFALVFLVLLYVYPLRSLTQSFAHFALGAGVEGADEITGREARRMMIFYGLGFAGLAATIALLHWSSLARLADAARAEGFDDCMIWTLIAATGIVSALLAAVPATLFFAPWTYATIPALVFGYIWWQGRRRRGATAEEETVEG